MYRLNDREIALTIENDTDAQHPSVVRAVKTTLKTDAGLVEVIIVHDDEIAKNIRRDMRPLGLDLADKQAVREFFWSSSGKLAARRKQLTGRAARYFEYLSGALNSRDGQALLEQSRQPWYQFRAWLESEAKSVEEGL